MKNKQDLTITNHHYTIEDSLFAADCPVCVAKENEEFRRESQEQLSVQLESSWLDEKSSESHSELNWSADDSESHTHNNDFLEDEIELLQGVYSDLDW